MDPPALSRGIERKKPVSEQMQSYIRPLGEGIFDLRALMKSALPLLIKSTASRASDPRRFWGSRSNRSGHQLDSASHPAVGFLNL